MSNLFSLCVAKLDFEFGRIDNRHMHLSVIHGDCSYLIEPRFNDDIGYASLSLDIQLPTAIYFSVSNKGLDDTIVDSDGNILKDCYIKLESLSLDTFVINRDVLGRRLVLNADNGQTVKSNYFGFNGVAVLDLNKLDVFSQVLTLNRHTD